MALQKLHKAIGFRVQRCEQQRPVRLAGALDRFDAHGTRLDQGVSIRLRCRGKPARADRRSCRVWELLFRRTAEATVAPRERPGDFHTQNSFAGARLRDGWGRTVVGRHGGARLCRRVLRSLVPSDATSAGVGGDAQHRGIDVCPNAGAAAARRDAAALLRARSAGSVPADLVRRRRGEHLRPQAIVLPADSPGPGGLDRRAGHATLALHPALGRSRDRRDTTAADARGCARGIGRKVGARPADCRAEECGEDDVVVSFDEILRLRVDCQ